MGGLEVNANAEVKNKSGVVIQGLYASGEVVGGVHGANRLGGNSLLDCVVYGRVAGASASARLLQTLSQQRRSNAANRLNTIGIFFVCNLVLSIANSFSANHLSGGISATIAQNGVQTRIEVDPKTNKLSIDFAWDNNGNTTGKKKLTNSYQLGRRTYISL